MTTATAPTTKAEHVAHIDGLVAQHQLADALRTQLTEQIEADIEVAVDAGVPLDQLIATISAGGVVLL